MTRFSGHAVLAVLALSSTAHAAPPEAPKIKGEDCTIAKQCPKGGDSCTFFANDKSPLCIENLLKSGKEPRCVDDAPVIRTVVGCPPGSPPAKTGLCSRASIAGNESGGLRWSLGAFFVAGLVMVRRRRIRRGNARLRRAREAGRPG